MNAIQNAAATRQTKAPIGNGQGKKAGGKADAKPDAKLAATGNATVAEAIADINRQPGLGTRPNAFIVAANADLTKQKDKAVLMQQVRQTLAQANDLFREGGDKVEEANSLAAKAGVLLYQGRVKNLSTMDEVNSALGDQFGFKKKGDGKVRVNPGDKEASKTPFGQGEAIRKRVVRLVQAAEFLAGRDGGRFFDGLEPASATEGGTTVEQVVRSVELGDMSMFRAYDVLADIKRQAVERTTPAFNPRTVGTFVSALSGPDAVEAFRSNGALFDAYKELILVLKDIGEALAKPEGDVEAETEEAAQG